MKRSADVKKVPTQQAESRIGIGHNSGVAEPEYAAFARRPVAGRVAGFVGGVTMIETRHGLRALYSGRPRKFALV